MPGARNRFESSVESRPERLPGESRPERLPAQYHSNPLVAFDQYLRSIQRLLWSEMDQYRGLSKRRYEFICRTFAQLIQDVAFHLDEDGRGVENPAAPNVLLSLFYDRIRLYTAYLAYAGTIPNRRTLEMIVSALDERSKEELTTLLQQLAWDINEDVQACPAWSRLQEWGYQVNKPECPHILTNRDGYA